MTAQFSRLDTGTSIKKSGGVELVDPSHPA